MVSVASIFEECVRAIRARERTKKASPEDKEFHFQNWFKARLEHLKVNFEELGRNKFPDFMLIEEPLAFEVKGLAGLKSRETFDCNSKVPRGSDDAGKEVYYVIGRYSKGKEKKLKVLDLVVCHGDFFNSDRSYVHNNTSFKEFGSYGDILVRDRKMYVAPTPAALLNGVEGNRTLIVPAAVRVGGNLLSVSDKLVRCEKSSWVGSYTFDMGSGELDTKLVANPGGGKPHAFRAYRARGDSSEPVTLRQ